MANYDRELKEIKTGDRERIAELGLTTSEISLVYSYWYEEYVARLKREGRRFPGTMKDIAREAFGREEDRQHLYKNKHIIGNHPKYLSGIGQESRATKKEKTRGEALAKRVVQLDSSNSSIQAKIDTLAEQNIILAEQVKRLEQELDRERQGSSEEMSAIEHLFETGRRVLL